MNTARQAVHPDPNTGSNVAIMISNVNWMNKNLSLTGSETITYFNNSPDQLTYLWLQLDENQHSSKNNANYQRGGHAERNYKRSID